MQPAPSILRQLAIMLYDALLMLALLGFATFLFILLFGDATQGWPHIALQLFLWIVAGVYFVYSWSRTGQTLAMKTWRVSVVSLHPQKLKLRDWIWRYVLASVGLFFFAAGFIWAWIDREHCSLHDRLLGFRLRLDQAPSDD
jgi:uncharacterized RDD family membrane protein YckC